MNDRSMVGGQCDRATIESSRWAHCLIAFAGAALLIGQMLGVLWPR